MYREEIVNSANDISEGGLFVCLLENCLTKNVGFEIITDSKIRKDSFLFGECQGRYIISVSKEKENDFLELVKNTSYQKIGTVTESIIKVDNEIWEDITYWKEKYENCISNILNQ